MITNTNTLTDEVPSIEGLNPTNINVTHSPKLFVVSKDQCQQMTEDELTTIISEVESFHNSIVECDKVCEEKGKKAIELAIETGRRLARAKTIVERGNWSRWLEDNLKTIGERTVQRYMKLAKTTHETDLNDCYSLRQAYIKCGITTNNDRTKDTDNDDGDPKPNIVDGNSNFENDVENTKSPPKRETSKDKLKSYLDQITRLTSNHPNLIPLLEPLVKRYNEYVGVQ